MKVLSWNLFHGRSVPGSGRELLDEFGGALASWDWDVALLQEVPPWWPSALAVRCSASMRMVLTSRNEPYWPRVVAGRRWPDLIKSGAGGANVLLVRGALVLDHRRARLSWWPERRVVHGVLLSSGVWVANLHASEHEPPGRTERDNARAGVALSSWAGPGPAILGGDFNLSSPAVAGFARLAGGGVDHVLGRGFARVSAARLNSGVLSDHAPIWVELRPVPVVAGSGVV